MKTFKDYSCKELVGQLVLFHTAFRSGKPSTQYVATISKASRHHFNISKSTQLQFDYSGRQLLKANAVQQSQLSTCILLTVEQASAIKTKWLVNRSAQYEHQLKQHQQMVKEYNEKLSNLQEI